MSLSKNIRLSSASKPCAGYCVLPEEAGTPRLAEELRAQGLTYNVKTVAASLRRQGLRAKAARRFSPVSYREHGLQVSENLRKQGFYASGPNQKWAGDITYCVPGVQGEHGCSNEPRVCLEY